MTSVKISVNNNVSFNITINNNAKLNIDIVDNDINISLDNQKLDNYQIDESKVTLRPNKRPIKICTPEGIVPYLNFVDGLSGNTKQSELWIMNNDKEKLKNKPQNCRAEIEYEAKALTSIKDYLNNQDTYEVTWLDTINQSIINYHRKSGLAFRNASIKDWDRYEDDALYCIGELSWDFQYKLYKNMYCLLHYYIMENQLKDCLYLITHKQLKWENPPEIDMWTQCYLWSVVLNDTLVGEFLRTNYFSQ